MADKQASFDKIVVMSFDQILEELPSFTVDERQILLRRVLEIDESRLSPDQESVVEARLSKDKLDPATSVPAAAMRERLRRIANG